MRNAVVIGGFAPNLFMVVRGWAWGGVAGFDGDRGVGEFGAGPVFVGGFDGDFAQDFGGLHDELGEAVEEAAPGLLVGFEAVGIAVADAEQAARTGDFELEEVVGDRDEAALGVETFNADEDEVFAVGVDGGAVGCEADGGAHRSHR
jgi:hypothetical protein